MAVKSQPPVAIRNVYIGHYHRTAIKEVDGDRYVHRINRAGTAQMDPRGLRSEEPLLRLLADAGLPTPRVRHWGSPSNHELEYISGRDLFPWFHEACALPSRVLERLVDIMSGLWSIDVRHIEDMAHPFGRIAPRTTRDFYFSLIEWIETIHRIWGGNVDPLLRALGFPVDSNSTATKSVSRALWSPFVSLSEEITERPLHVINGDISLKNLIFDGERLSMIDWELAGIGDPLWDIAVLIERSRLTPADEDLVLTLVERAFPYACDVRMEVRRYQVLGALKSIIVDSTRFPKLLAEDPDRLDGAVHVLAKALDNLTQQWRGEQADRDIVRDFLLARAVREANHANDTQLPYSEAKTLRRDTCGLDLAAADVVIPESDFSDA